MPYVICDLDRTNQSTIYYFPIVDSNNKIILIMCVMDTTNGLSFSASQEMVDELNNIHYTENPEKFIFYEENSQVFAEKFESKSLLYDMEMQKLQVRKDNRQFDDLDFKNKVDYIKNAMQTKFVKANVNITADDGDEKNSLDGYSPSYSVNTSSAKICSLYNSQGQGAFGRCWAASMATILNYLNGTDITAANVCDAMNIGYDTGASIDVAMNAMAFYSSSPYIYLLYDQTSFFEVEVNLDIKKPMYLSTVDTNDSSRGHAVALTGYVSDLWNSIV